MRNERRRISRELHDTVGHGLVVIAMNARRLPGIAPQAQAVADAIDEAVHSTMGEVRQLIGELRQGAPPVAPAPVGPLHLAIADLGIHLPDTEFGMTVDNAERDGHLPAVRRNAALRIVQESLTNAVKHGSGPIQVAVSFGEENLTLCVSNGTVASCDVRLTDIRPLSPRRPGSYGLIGLRERVAQVSGTFEYGVPPGGGFLVRARIPLDEVETAPAAPAATIADADDNDGDVTWIRSAS
ncbi:sensor histidine kinase [Spirillospora sp. CA-294931]|uniref:sensor histidine kinase n=1 Tax=Spirillospora sp. CA-294931 TaxID=3240042 RepID=UPI003D8A6403